VSLRLWITGGALGASSIEALRLQITRNHPALILATSTGLASKSVMAFTSRNAERAWFKRLFDGYDELAE
jgi:hypothetical protein